MSDSSIASRFAVRSGLSALGGEGEDELCDNVGCFGWLRGIRERAASLELRKKDGSILAINYAWLERLEFNPSDGITLHAAGQTIRIKGRHLNGPPTATAKLFEGLARHRVPWIQELSLDERLTAKPEGSIVEHIQW